MHNFKDGSLEILIRRLNEEVVKKVAFAVSLAGGKRALARKLAVQHQSRLSWIRGAIPSSRNIGKLEMFIEDNRSKK